MRVWRPALPAIKNMSEGYTKFNCLFEGSKLDLPQELTDLNRWRQSMRAQGLIGIYPDGIGFGNISLRLKNPAHFLISGSATGGVESLDASQIARGTNWNTGANLVQADGGCPPSSEALSHAAFYTADSSINGVIHIHSLTLWQAMLGIEPTTAPHAAYGSPDMAREIERFFTSGICRSRGLMVMAGHREGIFAFGTTLAEAASCILAAVKREKH